MQHSIEPPIALSPVSSVDRPAKLRSTSARSLRWAALPAMICACLAGSAHAQGLPFTETFDDQTFRDPDRTRASWGEGASVGQLRLTTAEPLASPFSDATVPADLPGEFATRSLALGDLDGDGDLDLAEGSTVRSGTYLWDSTTGTFAPRAIFESANANTRGVAIGDVDADGDLDVVAGNLNQRPRLFLNAGDGVTFTGSDIAQVGRRSDFIALVDVNADGLLDAVMANQGQYQNAIYLNTGNPLQPFGPRGVAAIDISNSGQNSQQVAWGDIDNDGDVDFVSLNENRANRIHSNNGDGTFSDTPIGDEQDDTQAGTLADLNGDGFLDLVVANSIPGQVNKIYLNTQDPSLPFVGPGAPFTAPNDPNYAHNVQVADADNDGDIDIFLSTAGPAPASEMNRLYLNDGAGTFSTYLPIGSSVDITNAGAVGDVDNDGDLDYVAGNENRDPNNAAIGALNRLYLNAGAPTGTQAPQLSGVATSLRVDAEAAPISSVRLRVNPAAFGAHNQVDFWVSANGGAGWVHAMPNRPVAIPPAKQGTDLRWRAVISSRSPEATQGAGGFAVDDVTLELNTSGPSRADAIGDQSATQDTAFGPLDASFTDADGDAVFHALTGLPLDTGITIDPLTGAIGGTPTNADAMASPIAVTLVATDGALRTEQAFTFTVANTNDAPVFTSTAPAAATGGTAYGYAVTVTDPDVGDVITITAPAVPAWLALTDNGDGTAALAGTPTDADVGTHNVSLVATDAAGATAQQDFQITVAASGTNSPPAFTSTAPTAATEGVEYVYSIAASDPNGDAIAITAPALPGWLVLTDNGDGTAALQGTPTASDVGDNQVGLQVADALGATAPQSFVITVAAAGGGPAPNQDPTIALNGEASMTVQVGAAFTDPGATASDPEDGDLTSQITVDNPVNTGVAGTYTVTYAVQDSGGATAEVQRTVIVQAPAQNPNPPANPPANGGGGGGGGGGGAAGLLELLGMALLAVARLGRSRGARNRLLE